jgi:plasmid stabilization system protein ParE
VTYRVRISSRALADADETYEWLSQNISRERAERWYRGLFERFEALSRHPLRHPRAAENDRFPEEIRESLYGKRKSKHRILYTVRGDEVVVLFIHHSSRGELEP